MVEILEEDSTNNVTYKNDVITTTATTTITTMETSEIQQYYNGSTVFITGATGFLGKIILEKLLRSCPEIKKIYIMVREKKGKSIEKRLEEMLTNVFFDRMKKEQPKFLEKITMVTGDCADPDLGLNDQDKQKLINEVNSIFHCAATVRFDEKIRTAAYINVRATRDLLNLGKQMKQLKSFIYISTAFSNCTSKEIKEEFYEPTVTGEKLLSLLDVLSDDMLDKMTPILIGKWPNTYAFTKALAENIVHTVGKGLPVAVVRPSIVIATVKEPIPGWIDNLYGATGVLVGVALGLIRTLHCKVDLLADMVPADYVINCSLAAAWDIGTNADRRITFEESDAETKEEPVEEIPIYNYVCSTQKPITWRGFMHLAEKHLKQIPSSLQVWHYCFILNSFYFMHVLCVIFLHRIPAYMVDFLAWCIGKQPILVKSYKRIDKFLEVLSYFATNEWMFENKNTQALWQKLNKADQQSFDFNMGHFNWDSYFYTYARGGRAYLLKDPLETVPKGRVKYFKLKVAHYALVSLLLLAFFKLVMVLWNVFV